MNKSTIIAFLFIATYSLLPFGIANAEPSFSRIIKGGGFVSSIIQTTDGGYILTGDTGIYEDDSFVIKLDGSGRVIWTKRFSGPTILGLVNSLQLNKIIEVDNGYVVAGSTYSHHIDLSTIDQDMLVLKLDHSGKIIWARTVGSGGNHVAHSIAKTNDGGYIVSGSSGFFRNILPSTLVVKLNSSGDIVWKKAYDKFDDNDLVANSIIPTQDGGHILAGQRTDHNIGQEGVYEVMLLKLSSTGNIQWKKFYRAPDFLELNQLIQLKEGGYALAATSYARMRSPRLLIIQLSSRGAVISSKLIDGLEGSRIAQTSDGGLIIGTANDDKGLLFKLDSSGNMEWQRDFGRVIRYGPLRSINLTSDGGYILAGTAYLSGGLPSVWIIKLDSGGKVGRCGSFNSTNFEFSAARVSTRSVSVKVIDPDLVTGNPSITTRGYPVPILASCP